MRTHKLLKPTGLVLAALCLTTIPSSAASAATVKLDLNGVAPVVHQVDSSGSVTVPEVKVEFDGNHMMLGILLARIPPSMPNGQMAPILVVVRSIPTQAAMKAKTPTQTPIRTPLPAKMMTILTLPTPMAVTKMRATIPVKIPTLTQTMTLTMIPIPLPVPSLVM